MRFLVLSLLLTLVAASTTSAQAQTELVGRVVSEKGEPIKDAVVRIVGGASDSTTSSGEFRISIPMSRVGHRTLLVVKSARMIKQLYITIPADSRDNPIIISVKSNLLSKPKLTGAQPRKPQAKTSMGMAAKPTSDKTKILIANFDSIDGSKTSVTATIITKLQNATKKYPDIEIEGLGSSITVEQGSKTAQNIGRKQNANIVIWGWQSSSPEKFQIDAHFEVLSKPKGLMLKQDNVLYFMSIAERDTYSVHVRLSDEMSYLALLTTGLARLEAKDYDEGISRLTQALSFTSTPDQMIDPYEIYIIRGAAYFDKAIYSLNRQEILNQAISDFDQAVKHRKDNADGLIWRSQALREKGRAEEALKDLNSVLEMDTTSEKKIEAYQAIVGYFYDIGDKKTALEYLRKAAQFYSSCCEDSESAFRFALMVLQYRTFLEFRLGAVAALSRSINARKNVDAQMRSLMFALRGFLSLLDQVDPDQITSDEDKIHRALGDLDLSIKLDSTGPGAMFSYLVRAGIYLESAQYAQALKCVEKAIKAIPPYTETYIAYRIRGLVYTECGLLNEAVKNLKEGVERNPNDDQILGDRAELHRQMGDYDEAIDDYRQAISLKPGYDRWYLYRSEIYEDRGALNLAIEDLTQAIRLVPGDYFPYLRRARIYRRIGELDKAIDDLSQVLTVRSNEYEAYSSRSQIYEGRGELDKAVDDLLHMTEIDPENEAAYYDLIRIYQGKGEMDKAAELRRKVLASSESTDRDKAETLGRTLPPTRIDSHEDETIAKITEAISLDPIDPSLYLKRADQYKKDGQLEKAIQDLTTSINLNTANVSAAKAAKAPAYSNRADIYGGLGQFDKAINDLSLLIQLTDTGDEGLVATKTSAHRRRAEIYRGMGDLDKAIADLLRCVELGGRGCKGTLSRVYEDRGEMDKALEVWGQGDKRNSSNSHSARKDESNLELLFPPPDPYRERSRIHERIGRLDAAIKDLSDDIEKKPQETILYSLRRDLYERKGEIEKAIDDLTQCIRIESSVAKYYLDRGVNYIKRSKRSLAVSDLKEAVKRSGEDTATKKQAQDKLKRLGVMSSISKDTIHRHPIHEVRPTR